MRTKVAYAISVSLKKGAIMNGQLKKGVMEIVVLSMLRRKDFYGYELVTEISKYIEMSEGTITRSSTVSRRMGSSIPISPSHTMVRPESTTASRTAGARNSKSLSKNGRNLTKQYRSSCKKEASLNE